MYTTNTPNIPLNCYSLRKIYHEKLKAGEIELERGNNVLDKPLPNHKGKETCNTIIHSELPEGREVEMMENTEVMEDDFDPGLQVTTLMYKTKFRNFFDQIGLTNEARIEATKAIIKAAEAQETCMAVNKEFVPVKKEKKQTLEQGECSKNKKPVLVDVEKEEKDQRKRVTDSEDARNIINAKRIAQLEADKVNKRKEEQKTKWERVIKPDGKIVFRL